VLIIVTWTRIVGVKPADKLLVHDTQYVVSRFAGFQPRQDSSRFGLVLVGIDFEIDSNWIGAKQQRCDSIE
jgi:hypothetical protein